LQFRSTVESTPVDKGDIAVDIKTLPPPANQPTGLLPASASVIDIPSRRRRRRCCCCWVSRRQDDSDSATIGWLMLASPRG